MKSNIIEISISGITSAGKSHVMGVIERALKDEYGIHTQVASYDLSMESNASGPIEGWNKPKAKNTVFILRELNA